MKTNHDESKQCLDFQDIALVPHFKQNTINCLQNKISHNGKALLKLKKKRYGGTACQHLRIPNNLLSKDQN